MAFDLNKNDGADLDSPDKKSTQFNLSKEGTETGVGTGNGTKENSSGAKIWIIGLVSVLIVGGGIWYYSSGRKTEGTGDKVSTEVTPSAAIAAGVPDRHAKADGDKAENASDSQRTEEGSVDVTAPASQSNNEGSAVETKPAPISKTTTKNAANLNRKIPATFAQGSSSLTRVDRSLIRRVVSYLAKNPAASIHVNGYASSDGSLAINQTISQARADAFKEYLVAKNIDGNRVVASGKGIENPIASNDTNAGRKKNRRVEIILQ